MSTRLLKQTLEEAYSELEQGSKEGGKPRQKKRRQEGTKRHGVKKERQRQQAAAGRSHKKTSGLSWKFRDAKRTTNDGGKAAMGLLLKLDGMSKLSAGAAQKIVEHNLKEKRQAAAAAAAQPESEGTVFTDEDFERLSKEYFIHSKRQAAAAVE